VFEFTYLAGVEPPLPLRGGTFTERSKLMNNSHFNNLEKPHSSVAGKLRQALIEEGIDFSVGVPCGVLRRVIDFLAHDERIMHITVNREPEAIGVAAGAYLAGKKPVIYIQNSGLFTASNDISSLLIPYRMPLVLIVSLRGCEGEDAPQHFVNGKATMPLLESFGIPYVVFEQDNDIYDVVRNLYRRAEDAQLPAVLLLKRGWDKT